MKFPAYKKFILPVAFCFAFYSIVGCSSTAQTTKYLDKYDSMPFKDAITVNASQDVAYKAAIVSLEKRGYIVTMSDPQTGIANLELNTRNKLPEDEKQTEIDNKLSTGTIILIALSIILIVGIIVILASSSDDDSIDKNKDTSKGNTAARNGGDKRVTGNNTDKNNSHSSERDHWHGERHHDYRPFIYPFIDPVVRVPSPDPSYLYIVTLNTTRLSETTTEVRLLTTRMDLEDGEVLNSKRFENKYLNYEFFDGIGKEMGR